MSKIALTPNASGSGTFTIASPNSDTDRSLTLPDGAGTLDRLERTGNILQVVQVNGTTTTSTTSGSFQDILSASITPSSSSSKVLVLFAGMVQAYGNGQATTCNIEIAIFKGATEVSPGVNAVSIETGGQSSTTFFIGFPIAKNYLDSPSTTSSTTYTVKHRVSSSDGRSGVFGDHNITLMEIAG